MRVMDNRYTTTILTSGGDPFEASFFISQGIAGTTGERVIRTEQLEATFEFDAHARAAANLATRVFVDSNARGSSRKERPWTRNCSNPQRPSSLH
jgi:hypothetical protein